MHRLEDGMSQKYFKVLGSRAQIIHGSDMLAFVPELHEKEQLSLSILVQLGYMAAYMVPYCYLFLLSVFILWFS